MRKESQNWFAFSTDENSETLESSAINDGRSMLAMFLTVLYKVESLILVIMLIYKDIQNKAHWYIVNRINSGILKALCIYMCVYLYIYIYILMLISHVFSYN